jgi:hypothetical protein
MPPVKNPHFVDLFVLTAKDFLASFRKIHGALLTDRVLLLEHWYLHGGGCSLITEDCVAPVPILYGCCSSAEIYTIRKARR